MTGKSKFNEAVKKFDDMTIPLGWIENVNCFLQLNICTTINALYNLQIVDDLTPTIELHLKLCMNVMPIAFKIGAVLAGLLGLICLFKSFVKFNRPKRKNPEIYSFDDQHVHMHEAKYFLSPD